MKPSRITSCIVLLLFAFSCGTGDNTGTKLIKGPVSVPELMPIDKGFSKYISGYTSGIIPANSPIEIHFTPEFAASADKSASGLFVFEPSIKGKTEWKDDATLVFTPSRVLDAGKVFTGRLNLKKLAAVEERLEYFPLRIQTLKKDFKISIGALECIPDNETGYNLSGQIIASDFIPPSESENYVIIKLGRKRLDALWDHSENLVHKFTVNGISRTDKEQELTISWDGSFAGVKQKGSSVITVPAAGEFSVLDVITTPGTSQKIDVVFSDPVDASQEMTGLIHFSQPVETTVSVNSNIVSILPAVQLQGTVDMTVEASLKNSKGAGLKELFLKQLDFSSVQPGIALEGNGVILPSSGNLIFPFKAANLKAVDLKIIKIFENNLPYFLQQSELTGEYSMRRFGRQVYSGRVDLVTNPGMNSGAWNLYTIDLSDYVDIEPGVLYKVSLSMRKSYSLYPCQETDDGKYDEMLQQAEARINETWDDTENYYEDIDDEVYYSFDFDYDERGNPCKGAYYSPERRVSRNVLASNLGLMAKKGEDNIMHIMVNDLVSALPVNEAEIEVFDYQMQQIIAGKTNTEGSVALFCERKPFLVIARKDKDRSYLKVNEGSSLSLSSFDVSGNKPENGIKAFIYGERDVWRPGDSIYLSLFIKDMKTDLPADHPVQFELINPLEQKVDNQVHTPNGSNLLVFTTKTPADAVTGNYKAVFRIGGATFTKKVRVETIKPNRLKINLEFPGDVLGGSEGASKGKLNVKWLNGSVAKNLKASVEYILKRTKTEFEKYSQYNFDDPIAEFQAETVNIFDENIDDEGNATVKFEPGSDVSAPGMLTAVFTAKAMEPGGDESITQTSYKYAPYPVFAGINFPGLKGKSRMLFTDADNEVKIVTVNEKGRPVSSEVEITVYKLSYSWWWESNNENLGYYISNNRYKPVITKKLNTSGGEASFTFNIEKNDWGRYLVRATTPQGHSTGKILLVDWPWDYGMKGNTSGATLLAINADKEKYNPGDEISLSFPSPENSRAIITLENSTGVIEELRVNTEKANTVVKLKAKPEMAPNVYAYVTIIQPHAQSVNDMPVRLYGVIPLMVEDPSTRLVPVIDMDNEVRSARPFIVKVSESGRKSMTYTLAVVDEGLLDITGFKTPDPWNYFYAREALGVQTWDLYDLVLGAFGGTLDRVLATGGDEALGDKAKNKAQRFIPIVKFLGPFTLGQGKTNSHAITLPQYTGSVRTMVIAGSDRAFGASEKSVLVKDPLMVLVTAPRVVSPGEKVSLPVTLFIQKESISEVVLKAEGNELVTFEDGSRSIKVSSTGEKNEIFSFTAGGKTGVAKINVTATGGGETATYSMELEVRSPNPPETRSELKVLNKGEKWQTTFNTFGIEGSNTGKLEISALPSINLDKRLEYLIDYPHGCSEQITSTAFPQLYLKEILGNENKATQSVPVNIRKAVSMIVSRQMANGGIALWPGSYQPDLWVTSYAGHFMLEAEKKGYSIPSGFRQKWISYQLKTARDWTFDPQYKWAQNDQAYRLFTLALAGQPEKGAMNRLREAKDLPQLSRWLLAAAFAVSGRPEAANGLLDMRNVTTEQEYQGYYYGSELRDKAIVLYSLILMKNEEQALPLLKYICDKFNENEWYSTQSLSWGLMSYMKWVEMMPEDKDKPSKVSITFNGNKAESSISAKSISTMALDVKGSNSLLVENTSGSPVYVTLTRKGTPLISDAATVEKGLSMKVDYFDMAMKPVDHTNLQQGTDFMMVVKVTNNTFSRVENIALTQMVPSGWEIRNTRLFEADFGIKENAFDYRDYRDDRVNTYFLMTPGQTKTFVLIATAAYTGEFYQPAVWCEAMYTPNCYARIPGRKVKVTAQ
jgi:uncharacterized protein YfaS (alpha-2-macroglobulin family)